MYKFQDHIVQVPGTLHGKRMEDVVYKAESDSLSFWALADGQSGKRYCVEGAKAVLETIWEYLRENQVWQIPEYLQAGCPSLIKCEVDMAIHNKLYSLADKYHVDVREFSSTLIAFSVNQDTGDYLMLHLGDGAVLVEDADTRIKMQSPPDILLAVEERTLKKYTWLTSSMNVSGHLRIISGNMSNVKKVFLLSNGMDCICNEKNITREGVAYLGKGDPAEMLRYLENNRPADDATCVMIWVNTNGMDE